MLKKKALFITLILAAMMIFSQFSMITYADNTQGDTYVLTFTLDESTPATKCILEDGQNLYLDDLRSMLGLESYYYYYNSGNPYTLYPVYEDTVSSDTSRIKVVKNGNESYIYADGKSWINYESALTLTFVYRDYNNNHSNTYKVKVTCANVSSNGEIIAPTRRPETDLIIDGTAENGVKLVNDGSTTIGSMQYRSNASTAVWSTEVPKVKVPGTYDVYYRVVTDGTDTSANANVIDEGGVIKDIVVKKVVKATVFVDSVKYGTVPAKYVSAPELGGKLSESDYEITYFYRTANYPTTADPTFGEWKEWDVDETTPVGDYQAYAEVKDLSGKVIVETPKDATAAKFTIADNIIKGEVVVEDVKYGTVPAKYIMTADGKLDESQYDITYYYREYDADAVPGSEGKWKEWDVNEKTPVGTYEVYAEGKSLDGKVIVETPKDATAAKFTIADNIIKGEVVVEDVKYGTVPAKYIMTADGKLDESQYDITYFYREYDADAEPGSEGKWKEWDVNEKTPVGTYEVYAEGKDLSGKVFVVTPKVTVGDKKVAQFTIADNIIEAKVVVEDVMYGTIPEKYVTSKEGLLKEELYEFDYFYRKVGSGSDKWNKWNVSETTEAGTYEVYAEGWDKATHSVFVTTPQDGENVATFTIKKLPKLYEGEDYHYVVEKPEPNCGNRLVFDGEKHGIKVVFNNDLENPVEDATVYYSYTKLNKDNYEEEGDINPDNVAPVHATGEDGTAIYYYIVAEGFQPKAGSVNVTIDKAYLRVRVKDRSVVYGTRIDYTEVDGHYEMKAYLDKQETEANETPVIEESIRGLNDLEFVMGDGYTNEMTDVGSYDISVAQKLRSDDYVIRYEKAILTITQKKVRFSWDHKKDYEFTYDGKAHGVKAVVNKDDLVGTDKREGLVDIVYEDNNKFPNTAVNVKRDADWQVTNYTARVQSLTGERAHNYMIDWNDNNAAFEWNYYIVPVEVTITPNTVTTVYGDKAVNKGYTVETLVNDEKQEDVIKGKPVYVFTDQDGNEYVQGSIVGEYKIIIDGDASRINKADGLRALNYQLNPVEGVMNVIKREITMVWSTPNKFEYDGTKKSVIVEKVKNDFTGKPAFDGLTYENDQKVNAGKYTAIAKLTEEDAWNYEVLNKSDHYDWQITKRPATVFANDNKIRYKDAPEDAGYYVDKKVLVVNEETGVLDSIGNVTFKFNYKKNGKPGNYKITPVVNNLNPNYYIAKIVKGNLTVNNRVTALMAQGKAVKKNALRITWNGVTGAKSYDVYMTKCDEGKNVYVMKLVKTTSGKSFTKKGLKKKHCYKYYVVAKNANGEVIAKSKIGHCATSNICNGETNVKTIKPTKKVVSIKRGASYKIKTKVTKCIKGKDYISGIHAPLRRYVSDNTQVATVDPSGKITGISKGWCKVYIQAPNGLYTACQVFVK